MRDEDLCVVHLLFRDRVDAIKPNPAIEIDQTSGGCLPMPQRPWRQAQRNAGNERQQKDCPFHNAKGILFIQIEAALRTTPW